MERSASIYGSSSALRGVQLKIGEKFKPPAKVTLPVGWKTRDPSRLLSLSYDFSLEEEVIKKVKAEREAREQQEHAQKVKEFVKTSTAHPVMANMGGDILQPTTATTTTTTTDSLNSTNENKQFNYKDFEDNTDTPFEAVELQCINSMEALKSVLQPEVEADSGASLGTTNSTSQMPQGTSNAQGIPIKGTTTQGNPHVSPRNVETYFPLTVPPLQVSNSYPPMYPDDPANQYPPMYPDDPIHTQMGQTVSQNTNPFVTENSIMDCQGPISTGMVSVSAQSNTASYSAANTDRKIPAGAMRVLPPAPFRPTPRRPPSVPNESMTSEMMSAFPRDAEAPATSPGQKRPVPKPRTKLPPLRNGPEDSIYDVPTSQVPPPLPPKKSVGKSRNLEHAKKPDVAMDEGNLRRYPSPLPPISPPKQTHDPPPPPINDPRSTMKPEEVQLVNQISTMGFPVARVARAVKNLGCKEREVIEFLISVNDMCSKGYTEGQVEMVLKENSDQTKAVEFLKLIVQFKELGFPEDKIFEALKKSECDSNKTLDILTCAG